MLPICRLGAQLCACNVQKERLEELWPRGASSLLLRLAADEPAYDSPLFDTGQACFLHDAPAKPLKLCSRSVICHRIICLLW